MIPLEVPLYYRPYGANKFNRIESTRHQHRCWPLLLLSDMLATLCQPAAPATCGEAKDIAMTLADHLFALIVMIGHPYAGYVSFKRLLIRVAGGEQVRRPALYAAAAMTQWVLFGLCLLLWMVNGRSWASLGFGALSQSGALLALLVTAAGLTFLGLQLREVMRASSGELQKLSASFGNIAIILPRNRRELLGFYGLALTAGIVEETLWRGFLIWYLQQLLPLWAAASIAAIGFGLAHAYQGAENLPKVTLVGALFVLLYLLSGALWLPILLHAAIDVLQGRTAFEIIRRTSAGKAGI